MTTKRPPSQLTLDLPMPGRGEASRQLVREVEVVMATHLMEAIRDPDNIEAALRAVVRNKGASGVDGMHPARDSRAVARVDRLAGSPPGWSRTARC